jgi:hypothetical protein
LFSLIGTFLPLFSVDSLLASLFFPFFRTYVSFCLSFICVGHFLLLLFISLFLYCVLYIPLFVS